MTTFDIRFVDVFRIFGYIIHIHTPRKELCSIILFIFFISTTPKQIIIRVRCIHVILQTDNGREPGLFINCTKEGDITCQS